LRRSNVDERVGQWTIPGGKVEKSDASYIAGAQRELREETGVDVKLSDLQYIGMPKPEKYYYLALEWEGEVKIDVPNPKTSIIEHDDYKWATIKEIKGLDNSEIPIYLLEEALEIYKEYKK
jgi:8-oxo-dGTP pyrophosphatase MutT (NUDIX family)